MILVPMSPVTSYAAVGGVAPTTVRLTMSGLEKARLPAISVPLGSYQALNSGSGSREGDGSSPQSGVGGVRPGAGQQTRARAAPYWRNGYGRARVRRAARRDVAIKRIEVAGDAPPAGRHALTRDTGMRHSSPPDVWICTGSTAHVISAGTGPGRRHLTSPRADRPAFATSRHHLRIARGLDRRGVRRLLLPARPDGRQNTHVRCADRNDT